MATKMAQIKTTIMKMEKRAVEPMKKFSICHLHGLPNLWFKKINLPKFAARAPKLYFIPNVKLNYSLSASKLMV